MNKYPTYILFVLASMLSAHAHAYIGPGGGLSAIGSLIALIGAVLLMIVGFFWYPIKRMIKGKKADEEAEDESTEAQQRQKETEE
jgi:hypothetical protein